MIKTFKGILNDGEQDQIHLAGGDGNTGYRIVKFQVMPEKPGDAGQESLVQVWKVKQSVVPTSSGTVDFSDDALIGAVVGIFGVGEGLPNPIIFDTQVFNQDIYVTHTDNRNAEKINYYIELDEVRMPDNETAVVNFNAALIHT